MTKMLPKSGSRLQIVKQRITRLHRRNKNSLASSGVSIALPISAHVPLRADAGGLSRARRQIASPAGAGEVL
jgi:hypothetical protein